jgi:hypothetical protein
MLSEDNCKIKWILMLQIYMSTCINKTNPSVRKGFGLDRLHCNWTNYNKEKRGSRNVTAVTMSVCCPFVYKQLGPHLSQLLLGRIISYLIHSFDLMSWRSPHDVFNTMYIQCICNRIMPKYTSTCMSCILLRMSEDELRMRLLSWLNLRNYTPTCKRGHTAVTMSVCCPFVYKQLGPHLSQLLLGRIISYLIHNFDLMSWRFSYIFISVAFQLLLDYLVQIWNEWEYSIPPLTSGGIIPKI